MNRSSTAALAIGVLVMFAMDVASAPRQVTFGAPATPVRANEPFVVTVTVTAPDASDCDKDVAVHGEMRMAGRDPIQARGACDSRDGSVFRVRFVPAAAGDYDWTVTYRQGDFTRTGRGSITVVD
jgi:hypothetical protein